MNATWTVVPTRWSDVTTGQIVIGKDAQPWIVCNSVPSVAPGKWVVRIFNGRTNKEHVVPADAKTAHVLHETTHAHALTLLDEQLGARAIHQEEQ